jgi:hypothetical protein
MDGTIDCTIPMVHLGTRRIGFREARRRLCDALGNPTMIVHEERRDQEAPHHQDASVVVHIIDREHQGVPWYIEWYCLEPNVFFISVHH